MSSAEVWRVPYLWVPFEPLMESDTDDPATAVSFHADSGGARNWGDEVKETTEVENELNELCRSVGSEPWFTSKQTSPNISLEDVQRELNELCRSVKSEPWFTSKQFSGGQQMQQQHAKPVAVAETSTTNLGGGVQFFTELNPGNFPNLSEQTPNPPLGVGVEVHETTTEDACSCGSLLHSDEAEADDHLLFDYDADFSAEAPFRRLLGCFMTPGQADRILSEAEGKYGAFENIMPFTDEEVQWLESVRPALLHLGLDSQTVQALLVPQLWKPKFLMVQLLVACSCGRGCKDLG